MADAIANGAEIFEAILAGDPPALARAGEVQAVEHRCDELTHDIVERLNRTFVTPIDREDIHALGRLADHPHHVQQDHEPPARARLRRGDGRRARDLPATALRVGISTTHTITGAIVGVGARRRLSAVRWGVAARILWAWLATIPGSAAIGALTYGICAAFGLR